MRYQARKTDSEVNVSKRLPLKEFFTLLAAAVIGVLLIYFVLGLIVDPFARLAPAKLENGIGRAIEARIQRETSPRQDYLDTLLDSLEMLLPEQRAKPRVFIIKNKQPNAFILPGGLIILHSGLYDQAESENEVSFVLAHELGHLVHRDHLRGFGRSFLVASIAWVFLGQENSLNNFLISNLMNVEMRYSREQERKADIFALTLLNLRYGHTGGAADFFRRMAEKDDLPAFGSYFSSHPNPISRVEALEKIISDGMMKSESVTSLKIE